MDMLAAEPAPLEKATMRKVILRLVPFLMICYFFALLDRCPHRSWSGLRTLKAASLMFCRIPGARRR